MRTYRLALAAALALFALSGCYIIFNFDPPPGVDLTATRTWVVTGQASTLTASAWDPQGDPLTYEWYEDGSLIAGVSSFEFDWRYAVESTSYVTVSVIVRDNHGGSATDSVQITVDPRDDGAIVIVNDSSTDIWWVYDRKLPKTWSTTDRLGSSIIPAGTRYVIVNNDTGGYSTGYWDIKAEDSTHGITWEQDGIYLYPGRVATVTFVD